MDKIVERFLGYVALDTKSDPDLGESQKPSTKGQFDLANKLKGELEELGLSARINEECFLFSKIPANTDEDLPKVGFLAHMDTSPEMDGKNDDPQIFKYDGGDIKLNESTRMTVADFPILNEMVGKTLITTHGESLLGADDKAGVAAIMDAVDYLIHHPEIKHGEIEIAFTPDEEIGTGCDSFDVEGFGADFAYTIDGGGLGELEYESFNACDVTLKIKGKSVHPGSAKDTMINSVEVAKELDNILGGAKRPEHTEGYEGFYHLTKIEGSCEFTRVEYIIRDHDRETFEKMKTFFQKAVDLLNFKYGDIIEAKLDDVYYNMGDVLKDRMEIVNYAIRAMENLDIKPLIQPIRGGTDGSKLSYMGLPTPNIFTGGYNFHGKYEFIPIEDMKKASQTIVEIVKEIYK